MHQEVSKPVRQIYERTFGEYSVMSFAPGRANIIGEHTDYNEGFVLPFAIQQGLYFYAGLSEDGYNHMIAADTGESWTFSTHAEYTEQSVSWSRYIYQALKALNYQGPAFNMVFGGNLPAGAGISSSSALTCGFIFTVCKLADILISDEKLLHYAVEAEVGSGVKGGMMDQFTIINGQKEMAILLDCKSLKADFIFIDPEIFQFLLIHTHIKHNLVETDYNNRRSECDEAVDLLNKKFKHIQSLRDIQDAELHSIEKMLPFTLMKRVNHVIHENSRVLEMVKAIKEYDIWKAGTLLYQSHQSLSLLYEVSCPELDFLVNWASSQSNVYGARMMGGGFGGCTINLVQGELSEAQRASLFSSYKAEFGHFPELIKVIPGSGMI